MTDNDVRFARLKFHTPNGAESRVADAHCRRCGQLLTSIARDTGYAAGVWDVDSLGHRLDEDGVYRLTGNADRRLRAAERRISQADLEVEASDEDRQRRRQNTWNKPGEVLIEQVSFGRPEQQGEGLPSQSTPMTLPVLWGCPRCQARTVNRIAVEDD